LLKVPRPYHWLAAALILVGAMLVVPVFATYL